MQGDYRDFTPCYGYKSRFYGYYISILFVVFLTTK
jgi:hypothetical protein